MNMTIIMEIAMHACYGVDMPQTQTLIYFGLFNTLHAHIHVLLYPTTFQFRPKESPSLIFKHHSSK